ncbi:hypothetical protein E4U21_002736, partial [Claviceps maximensis]
MFRLVPRQSHLIRAVIPTRRLNSFTSGPAPPKLPPAQQAEFERLQRAASLSSAFQPS